MSLYFDELERQLERAHAKSSVARRRIRPRVVRPLALAAALIAVVAILPMSSLLENSPEMEATAPVTSTPVSADLIRDFPIFGHEAGPDDSMGGHTKGGPAINDGSTRAIRPQSPSSGPGRAVTNRFFVGAGANESMCVLVLAPDADGPGSTCASHAQAVAGRAYLTIEHDGGWEIAGFAPPGSRTASLRSRDGEVTHTAAREGVYSVWLPERAIDVSFTTK